MLRGCWKRKARPQEHRRSRARRTLGGVVVELIDQIKAGEVVATYCKAVGAPVPPALPQPDDNEGLYYTVAGDARPICLDRPRQEHNRHTRKYAEGRLGSDRSFYFRSPGNALNLRAHNLRMFLETAAGIGDRSWEHHRQAGDYSRWFREAIKNEQLAREAAAHTLRR